MSEGEHHSHRTDEEWRAIIRHWREKLNDSFDHPSIIGGIVMQIITEMDEETK